MLMNHIGMHSGGMRHAAKLSPQARKELTLSTSEMSCDWVSVNELWRVLGKPQNVWAL